LVLWLVVALVSEKVRGWGDRILGNLATNVVDMLITRPVDILSSSSTRPEQHCQPSAASVSVV
jgi:hypothetical protein